MFLLIGILIVLAGIITIYFNIPCSKTEAEFIEMTKILTARSDHTEGVFREEDIAGLPTPVQTYFRHCGYIGTPKMSYINITYQDVDFLFDKDKPLKIDYTQFNFVNKPNRIAYIDSSMYGIPFEGLDSYVDGAGSMKGVIAKLFTLFHQTGKVMDKSSLVTFLSESLLIPNAALQDYIIWEAIDDFHAKATISCYGISTAGIFTFNEKGEMLSFTTDDREAASIDGTSEKVKWSIVCGEYKEINGIKKPTLFQAVWNYDDGDVVYFNGRGSISAPPATKDQFLITNSDEDDSLKERSAKAALNEMIYDGDSSGSTNLAGDRMAEYSIRIPSSWTLEGTVFKDSNNNKIAEIAPVVLLKQGEEAEFLDYKTTEGNLLSKESISVAEYKGSKVVLQVDTEVGSWFPHMYRISDGTLGFTLTIYSHNQVRNEVEEKLFDEIVQSFRFKG